MKKTSAAVSILFRFLETLFSSTASNILLFFFNQCNQFIFQDNVFDDSIFF